MAQKRMFSLQVIDTDQFMDMPLSTQALYFHLGMHRDDDGFVASPKKIARAAGCNDDDLRLLAVEGYIIPFDSGVIVVTDWNINNTLKNDRYRETAYLEEKAALIVDKSGRYILGTKLEPECFQPGTKVEPQHNLTEHNLTEQSVGADKPPRASRSTPAKPVRKEYGQFGWVKLSDEEYSRLLNDLGETEVKRCIAYIDEAAQSTGNKNKWRDWNLVIRRCHRDRWGLGTGAGKPNAKPVPSDAEYLEGWGDAL